MEGHRRGATSVKVIARAANDLGIRYLTLYALSTENLSRPREELDGLMTLLRQYMRDEMERLIREGTRLRIIGDMNLLPKDIREELREVMEKSRSGTKMDLIIALCYGSREEMIRAINRLEGLPKSKRPNRITESAFSRLLDTHGVPDPDLLIRTGGERRISNFLLWQMAYTELYFTDVLWPDFRRRHILSALRSYSRRERRFGLTSDQVKKSAQHRAKAKKLR